jgi:putative copper resistance protein D
MTLDLPAPTLAGLWTTWTWSPVADVLIAAVLLGYLFLVVRHRRDGHAWPAARVVSGLAAGILATLAVNSALAVYGHQLFWVHMLVHLILIMIVPALAVWAQPIRLVHDAGGARARAALDRIGTGWAFRVLVAPWLTVPLYVAVLVLTHLTGFQQAMSQHMWIHDAELALYLVSGYLLFLPLVGDELTTPIPPPPLLRFAILALCMGPDTLVGITLMMTGRALAPAYAAGRDWGPSALVDQSAAGAIMWFGGDGLMMILMVVVGGRWITSGDVTRSLGPWLDRIRYQAVLGTNADIDIDDDDAALAAYNARLAALHGQVTPRPYRHLP